MTVTNPAVNKLNKITLSLKKTSFVKKRICGADDAAQYIGQFYQSDIDIYESFFILLLDRANNTIGYAKISQGGCVGTVIDTKIIAKYCIDSLAQSVILAHNHPSGNKQPSTQDIEITKKVKNTLAIFDCQVHDHIILTSENGFFSMQENGLI